MSDGPERLDVYPVTWMDEDDIERNAWSRNHFTEDIEPDPGGDPLYTTIPPRVSGDQEGTSDGLGSSPE